jgi:hypothetical protein
MPAWRTARFSSSELRVRRLAARGWRCRFGILAAAGPEAKGEGIPLTGGLERGRRGRAIDASAGSRTLSRGAGAMQPTLASRVISNT